jgi:hypothetical protein
VLLVFCSAPPINVTPHNSHLEKEKRNGLSMGIRLGGKGLHTTRSIAQLFWGVVLNVSSHLYNIVALMACKLVFSWVV